MPTPEEHIFGIRIMGKFKYRYVAGYSKNMRIIWVSGNIDLLLKAGDF
jgi:hypothetical protein